jgi:HlyD family secretion protein
MKLDSARLSRGAREKPSATAPDSAFSPPGGAGGGGAKPQLASALSRWRIPLIVIAAVLLVAVGYQFLRSDEQPKIHFRLAEVSRGSIVNVVSASGTLKPAATVAVPALVSGQVAEVNADFNSAVHAGDPLARLVSDVAEAQVQMATADLAVARGQVDIAHSQTDRAHRDVDNARAMVQSARADVERAALTAGDAKQDLQRTQTLRQTGDASRVDQEKARSASGQAGAALASAKSHEAAAVASLASAQAQATVAEAQERNAQATVASREAALKQAQLNLAQTVVRSPIDGVVIDRNVAVGQTVAAGSQGAPLFTIADDLRHLELHASIDEADIGRVAPGQEARFSFDAFPSRTFSGKVVDVRKMPQVVQGVVSYDVVISVVNDDQKLLPGMTADVRIVAGERNDVVKVPNAAFRFHPADEPVETAADANTAAAASKATVWRLGRDGRPYAVAVQTGLSDGIDTEIVAGDLKPGQKVIVGASRTAEAARTEPPKF